MPKLPMGDIGTRAIILDYGTDSGQANLRIDPVFGQIKFKAADSISPVQEEAYGDADVDGVFSGTVCEMEVPMARSTLLQLVGVLPGAALVGNVLTFSNKCGSSMYDVAVPVCLKPIIDGVVSTDKKSWILVYKCHAYRSFELPFDRSTQRVHLVKFKVFPMQESGYEGKYFQEGVV